MGVTGLSSRHDEQRLSRSAADPTADTATGQHQPYPLRGGQQSEASARPQHILMNPVEGTRLLDVLPGAGQLATTGSSGSQVVGELQLIALSVPFRRSNGVGHLHSLSSEIN